MDWRVRFVDYPEQWRRQRAELLPIIEDTIARGDLMLRQQLHDFEEHLAAFNSSPRAVGVSNCTDGLRLLAHALDIGPGDEVVTVRTRSSPRSRRSCCAVRNRSSSTSATTI